MAEGHVTFQHPAMVRAAGTPHCLMNRPFQLRPSLVELCVPILSRQSDILNLLASFPSGIRSQVTAKLPLDLPLLPCSQFIFDENYWKRRALFKWKTCDTSVHGHSWKKLFFERNLADALENFDPTLEDETVLVELMETTSLGLAPTLAILDLSCNQLDDEKIKIILEGTTVKPGLLQLNLCHNRIGDLGIAEFSKFLMLEKCSLTHLNIGDNHFSSQGAKDIAEALKRNTLLKWLNLAYNTKIQDEGGQAIFDALQSNRSLQGLRLASCGLGEEAATSLGRLISSLHSPLLYIDVSANPLIGKEGGAALQASMETGRPPIHFDLQLCGVGENNEEFIANVITTKNDQNLRTSILRNDSFQI